MNPPSASSEDIFLNVRKAYRLLHDYQQMVIDAIRYIGSQLDIAEWGGTAQFAGDARSSYRYMDQSSWDWLPMMGWCFHFVKPLEDNEWLSLSFLIISDTGFIEGNGDDKTQTEAFKCTNESSTKIAFFLYKAHASRFPVNLDNRVMIKSFISSGGDLPEGVVGECYDMSCLSSEEQANKVVVAIIELAQQQGLQLERQKKFTQA
jgi:hypothetical protein